jgi:hypothetical protein
MKFKGGLTYRNFLNYFGNKLEKKEKHAFEKRMMQDSFESEAFDGLSRLSAEEFEKDMLDLDRILQVRTKEKKRRMPLWFSYVASILILLSFSFVLYYLSRYFPQDEMIGAQVEEVVPKEENQLAEPIISKQDSESMDLMKMIDEDLEIEITDADEFVEPALSIENEEEEQEEEMFAVEKSIEPEIVEPAEQVVFADKKIVEESEMAYEKIQSALQGQIAEVEVQKAPNKKLVKRSFANNSMTNQSIISGKVVDEEDLPMLGVSIAVKGSAKGTVTDYDGYFKLDVSDSIANYRLIASFVGYEPKEVNAQADSSLLLVLQEDKLGLSEVIVVAYGTSKTERGNTSWEKARPIQFASIAKFKEDLAKELENANLEHLQGTYKVKFSFIVEPDGVLSEIKFKGNPDAILRKEIERLLLNSEDWHSAESAGKAVASRVRISLKLDFD